MANLDLWRRWDPFRDFRSFDRLLEDFYSPRWKELEKVVMSPSVDLTENKNAYMMKFDLPGVSKDQIKIDLHDNVLTVSGERREEKETDDKDTRCHLREVSYGSFSRSFRFPEAVDAEKAEAKFEDGVLRLTIPKKEGAGKRQITIR
ncbi:MAG: Hsp20/alpha crystallin family protein [Bdellovibrionaceae bacterium]|nr:Hsp20/alpha crystallin family protein [Pseudobdellovibrionaceae bacterium]